MLLKNDRKLSNESYRLSRVYVREKLAAANIRLSKKDNLMSLPDGSECIKRDLAERSEHFLRNVLSLAMNHFEVRDPQLILLIMCACSIEKEEVIAAQAGTGTGKTFAYLIPIILSAKKAIVTTRTVNLQEQLVLKDLKKLADLIDFSYAIAKGRSHYLCLRRFGIFKPEDEQDFIELQKIKDWLPKTTTGELHAFDKEIFHVKERICSDSDMCEGKRCKLNDQCFYYAARRKWAQSQIVVANHSLLGQNAKLSAKSKILPEVDILVADEAHSLDAVLTEAAGSTISDTGIENILRSLLAFDEKGKIKGLLVLSAQGLLPSFEHLRSDLVDFWAMVSKACEDRKIINGRFKVSAKLDAIADKIDALLSEVEASPLGLFEEGDVIEVNAQLRRLQNISKSLKKFRHESEGHARWVELGTKKISLRTSPIYPASFVANKIRPLYKSIILTSATLAPSGDFSIVTEALGLKPQKTKTLHSPFNLKEQINLEIKRGIDLSNEKGTEQVAKIVLDEALRREGGLLVLFTSSKHMRKTAELCAKELRASGFNFMMQGQMSNKNIMDIMRNCKNAVTFGLDSFWEGVDIEGDSLKTLIITKLPFEPPTEPINAARSKLIEKRNENPFVKYALPRAMLKFKQGVGRLIRSSTDTGRLIICDDRIKTEWYGEKFLEDIYRG